MKNNTSSGAFRNPIVCCCLVICIFLLPVAGMSGEQPIGIAVGTGESQITRLDGSAHEIDAEMQVIRSLARGNSLQQGSRVRVAERSRIELRLPDGSYIRFDAGAVFELTALSADRSAGKRNINVNLVMGNVWATVSKIYPGRERFDITTKTSVAGIRGTKYRMNVHADQSSLVRVYDGAIEVKSAAVSGPPKTGTPASVSAPYPVPGPRPVPGPHPVSMEEWVYIVKAMQQLIVRSDGTAEKPAPFSYEEDLDGWVSWNLDLDEQADPLQ